ncbi:MAG TPA: ABC transporter ATP-binding protein [Acidimicrobiales bacterium]|nr:ABC transporter ATP-binding protein [Acidimicrobiales bacterium]
MAQNVLTVDDLRTEFRMRHSTVTALDGVSLSVDQGECVGIVGESGCGKSTAGLSIMRLLPNNGHVTRGRITLLGRDIATLDEREMRRVRGDDVALIPQDPMTSLNPTMSIGKQIAEGVLLHRDASKEQARLRALEVLKLVEMPRPEERLDQYPHELSGGLRQRVIIAMALACEPKLLIADEPTTALDVTIQAQILDLIDDLRERLHMGVILITHDMGVIAGRADRVVVMYAGRIVEEARTTVLFEQMRHPYAEALLASVPKIDQDPDQSLLTIPGLPPDLSNPITNCRFAPRCMYATAECREQDPPMTHAADTGAVHQFACFHPVQHDASGETPAVKAAVTIGATPASARAAALTAAPTILSIDNLVKEFPVLAGGVIRRRVGSVHAVSNVSLAVRKGETFGIVGESGCGKTTVGRMMVALERPTSGSVVFDGSELSALHGSERRASRRDIQLMFQDPYASLDPRMRVGTIIAEPLRVQRVGTRDEQRERVAELLREVGLSQQSVERYPHEFSGGQRQRIGLARALALQPRLVVADEPVSALDVSIQAQILNLMKSLQRKHDLTYVMISHDLAVIRYMADTIGVMYLGKLVELGPSHEVYSRPAHPYTQALLDAVPSATITSRGERKVAVRGELPSAVNPPSGCRFRTRCPRAQSLCAEAEPLLTPFGPEHTAACHFPLQTPVTLSQSSSISGT